MRDLLCVCVNCQQARIQVLEDSCGLVEVYTEIGWKVGLDSACECGEMFGIICQIVEYNGEENLLKV